MKSLEDRKREYTDLVHAGDGITIDKGTISSTGGGGTDVPVVNVTYDSATDKYSVDMAISDIKAYVDGGIIPVFIFEHDGMKYNFVFYSISDTELNIFNTVDLDVVHIGSMQ